MTSAVHPTAARARRAALGYIRSAVPGVLAAYCVGSAADLPPDAPLPAGSDFDVMAVVSAADAAAKPGKMLLDGALVEVSLMPWSALEDIDSAKVDYHIAHGLRREGCVLWDPKGLLAPVQREIARDFASPAMIRRRVRNARDKAGRALLCFDESAPSPQRLNGWLFPAGVLAQAVLVAAQRNPTVRRRYADAKAVLEEYGLAARYEPLLALSGFDAVTPAQALEQCQALAVVFDDAASAAATPFFFSSDITALARPLSVDGSFAMIAKGLHREAMFWIAATFARCEMMLLADAPALAARHQPAFGRLRELLGVPTPADEARRAQAILCWLPALDAVTEAIIGASIPLT